MQSFSLTSCPRWMCSNGSHDPKAASYWVVEKAFADMKQLTGSWNGNLR